MSTTPFQISRKFKAPRALVFEVYTQVEHLTKWQSPVGFKCIKADQDFRAGGHYHYGLENPEGAQMWGRQDFLEIIPNEKLVFLQAFSNAQGELAAHPMAPTWPLQMHSTVTFSDAEEGQTLVTITWVPYNASAENEATFDNARAGMEQGWGGTFAQLDAYLETIQ